MAKRKSKEKEFKITIRNSSLPEEEKRELLFECFDILLSERSLSKNINSKKEKDALVGVFNK